ncbi:MAG: prephenate dehydrogenase/arogenate dehydrogenase family protein [Isosphaera sp.]|nr:prephenate dehydrogenase/arogenate dehydrogenase family protein [Isosphaera sp.]
MRWDQVTVVGVGLIGGSVGMAARARRVAGRVVGVGRDHRTLARAVELGAIDAATTDLADGVKDADLVVVCTPVDRIAETVLAAAARCRPGTIFTDAGSTKGNVVEGVGGKLPAGVHFVPAHPIAGSEKAGVEHATADLFDGRVTVVTEMYGGVAPDARARVEGFWRALGSRVVYMMSPGDHDRALAVTSHLPHAVAAALADIVPPDWLTVAGPGFRDATRIAAGDPGLWAAIFLANRVPVLSAVNAFRDKLAEFYQLLDAGDGAGLVAWLAEAKRGRDALGR